jgi:hypothetical protein
MVVHPRSVGTRAPLIVCMLSVHSIVTVRATCSIGDQPKSQPLLVGSPTAVLIAAAAREEIVSKMLFSFSFFSCCLPFTSFFYFLFPSFFQTRWKRQGEKKREKETNNRGKRKKKEKKKKAQVRKRDEKLTKL